MNPFVKAVEQEAGMLEYTGKSISRLIRASQLIGDVEGLEDVSSVNTLEYNPLEISFFLKEDAKASKLVHKLTQKFQVPFEKSPEFTGAGLKAIGTLPDGTTIVVHNYLPQTCTIVEEEVEIPEDERPTKRKVKRVVCNEG